MFQASKNQTENLVSILDGYFNGESGGQHLNVNVLKPEDLRMACEHPETEWGNLVVRISGYAIRIMTSQMNKELSFCRGLCMILFDKSYNL